MESVHWRHRAEDLPISIPALGKHGTHYDRSPQTPSAGALPRLKVLPKMKSGIDQQAGVEFSVTVDRGRVAEMLRELRLAVNDLGLKDRLRVRKDEE